MLARIRSNRRGVTLVEALAVLVMAALLGGSILLMIQQMNSGTAKLTARETAARQARQVLAHMVDSIRKEPASTSQDAATGKVLQLVYGTPADEHNLTYQFDSAAGTLSYTEVIATSKKTQTLASKVQAITVTLEGRKLTIDLRMQLPNGGTYPAKTTAYLPAL
jgi:type II secretory pathway pseudopilin PulG